MKLKLAQQLILVPPTPMSDFCLPFAVTLFNELLRLVNNDEIFFEKVNEEFRDKHQSELRPFAEALIDHLSIQTKIRIATFDHRALQSEVTRFIDDVNHFLNLFKPNYQTTV